MLSGLMITYYTDIRSQLLAQRADERFIPIIEYAAPNGSVTNSDVQRILNTNRTTAYRLLQQMETWLEMQGVTGKKMCIRDRPYPHRRVAGGRERQTAE